MRDRPGRPPAAAAVPVASRSADPRSARAQVTAAQLRAERTGAFLLYVGLVVVHLFLDLTMSGPVVYTDEGGYMGTAHLLVSGTGLLYNHSPYHPGYSVLLVPLVRLFPDPLKAYRATLILNAMLLAGLGVAVFILSRHLLPRRAVAARLAMAAIVASYPAFLDYSNLVMSMNLFIPLFTVLCILVVLAFQRERPGLWLLCGAVAGALYIVHPTGLVVILALALVALVIRRRRWLTTVVAMLLGLQLTLLPGLALMQHVQHVNAGLGLPLPLSKTAVLPFSPTATTVAPARAPARPSAPSTTVAKAPRPPQSRTRDVLHLFQRNLSPRKLGNDAIALAGQVFYLVVGTYGLFVLGMAVSVASAWRVVVRRSEEEIDRLALFIGLVMVGTLISSALRFNTGRNGTGQSDELIYGRYNELVLAPVLVLGVLGLYRLRRASWSRTAAWLVGTTAVVGATGATLYAGRSQSALRAVFVDVNVFALHPLLTWLGGIDVLPLAAIGVGAVTVVALLGRRLGLVGVAVPVVAVCALSAAFSANRLSRDSDGRTGQRVIISAIHKLAASAGPLPHCVGYDVLVERVWHLSNDQFFLPTTKFRRFNSFGEQPCSDIVITARTNLNLTYPGARLVALENFSPTKLWVLPGPRLDRLEAAGMVLPAGFPSVLPDSAFKSSIRVVGLGPGTDVLPGGGARDIVVAVTHTGSGAPWPSRYGFVSGQGWVRLAVVWVARSSPLVPVAEAAADLPRTLFPGDSAEVRLHLVARDVDGAPLPPGDYFVRIGLVQEGYSFFTDKGARTLDLAVSVAQPRRAGR